MLRLENISLTFGERTLLDGISTLINPGERVGLVGPNGTGKSTLLKIIAGEILPDAGNINMSKAATVGYLPQDGVEPDPKCTVYEEMENAFGGIIGLEEQLQTAQHELAELEEGTTEYRQTMEQVGLLQEKVERSGAYTLQSDIEKILMGLGFSEEDFNRSTTEFSGGWLMRIALGKLLLKKPMYLLLDEPTNHLDIESLSWLEQFLIKYKGAVIIVSHDKAFLNKITDRTLALEQGDLLDYKGNYSYYEEKHAEYLEHRRKAYENQQKEIREIQDFIDKFRYNASKAAQVQSRIKQLEKIDEIEIDDREEEISFSFPEPERSGAVVMKLDNILKKYGENIVFEDLSYSIARGDKIAVVGPNGAGKSTMIRMMAGLEDFSDGQRKIGHNVTVSYFAQHQADELNLDSTVFEVMREAAPNADETRIRTILGCFLFQGDDVFKRVSVLSGGEKSRLALARMLLQPANFLIFDEPTNHLDMQSKEILQQALNQYEGTYLIVSHDRDFLDPIVDKVLEVRPNTINTFLSNVSYYLDKVEEREVLTDDTEQDTSSSNGNDSGLSRKEERRIEAQKRQQKYDRLKPLKKEFDPLEDQIEKMEHRKDEIEALMAQPDFYEDEERVKEISMEYEKLKAELVEVYARWEDLALQISEIEEEFS
ncbi:MAG TPA: ABC-F family ATP-binding cassette domain-containing protein [Balneolaceae bacterium]|nr:ABC-F family ATP-binding cassette domain-containing protein [Balneolaceae bacterium]